MRINGIAKTMKPDLTFVICTERGFLENMSVLFVMSLRMFGGKFSDCNVLSYQPRKGYEISQKTQSHFDDLNVTHKSLPLNHQYVDYPLANKPLVCAHAEKNCESELLVFADSDQLILNEPNALEPDHDADIVLRPVDVKNIGAANELDPNYEYWGSLYDLLSVGEFKYVESTVDKLRIFAYWNSGLIVSRRRNFLFNKWEKNFHTVMSKGLQPQSGGFFVEQSVLAATICSTRLRIGAFPNSYNYPVHMQPGMQSCNKIEYLSELTTIHYHSIFQNNLQQNPLKDMMNEGGHSDNIREILCNSGVYYHNYES